MQKTPDRVRARVLALFAAVFVAFFAVGGSYSLALADEYLVSYHPGDYGIAETMTPQKVTEGDTVVVKENTYSRDKYSFLYWEDSDGLIYHSGESVVVNKDIDLFAKWQDCKDATTTNTITFKSDVFGSQTRTQTVYSNYNAALYMNIFSKPNNQFMRWKSLKVLPTDPESIYDDGAIINIDRDITLIAEWNDTIVKENWLSYDANTNSDVGVMASASTENGELTVAENGFASPAGMHFVGWNTKANGSGDSYDPGDTIYLSGNRVLYAQWSTSAKTCTISFSSNASDATGTMSAQTVSAGVDTALKKNEFSRSGYYFSGWSTSPTGSVSYSDGGTINATSDLTLYAHWSTSPVGDIVRFHSGLTGLDTFLPVPRTSGMTFKDIYDDFYDWVDDLETFVTGNTLLGWSSYAYARTPQYSYNSTQTVPTTSNDWYAVWSGGSSAIVTNSVTIQFNSNYPSDATGTSGSMSNQTIGTSSTTLNQNNFKCNNYTFKYWTYQSSDTGTHFNDKATVTANTFSGHINGNGYYNNGNTYYTNNSYVTQNGYVVNGNNINYNYNRNGTVTLYAQWNKGGNENITVTFNANGGTGTMSNQSMKSGTSTALKQNTFKRDGYTFDGWNTSANGSGTSYTNGQSVTLSSDQTLYAQWKQGGDSSSSTPTPVTPPNTPTASTSGTTPTTPTASTSSTTPAATIPAATGAIPAATLAATGDSTNYGIIVAAIIAGIGIIVVGLRFRKNSKR